MPILSLIVPKHQIVLTRAFEELVDEELSEHEMQLGKHAAFSKEFRQIVDARFILKNSTSDENMAFAAKNTPFAFDSRRAIVVIREENFPDAKRFSSNTGSSEFQVTRDMGGAMLWMNLNYNQLKFISNFLRKEPKQLPKVAS